MISSSRKSSVRKQRKRPFLPVAESPFFGHLPPIDITVERSCCYSALGPHSAGVIPSRTRNASGPHRGCKPVAAGRPPPDPGRLAAPCLDTSAPVSETDALAAARSTAGPLACPVVTDVSRLAGTLAPPPDYHPSKNPRGRRGFWQGRRAASSADRSASGPYRWVAVWPRWDAYETIFGRKRVSHPRVAA